MLYESQCVVEGVSGNTDGSVRHALRGKGKGIGAFELFAKRISSCPLLDHVHRSTPPCFGIHLATLRMLQRALREESEEREARSRSGRSGRQTLDGRALLQTVSV